MKHFHSYSWSVVSILLLFVGFSPGLWAQESCDGGTISTPSGADSLYYCVSGTGGGGPIFEFDSTGTAGSNFTYVVTDTDGVILGVPPRDSVNFADAGPGECWVWGLSYDGELTAQLGDTASTTMLSDSCFDLSDNFIVVFRDEVEGGTVATVEGQDTVAVCIGASPASYDFSSEGAAGGNFSYVVTDNNGVILGVPPGNTVDFSGAGPGECWVWGLSYTGELLAQIGDTASAIAISSGCFDLSDNFVVVIRDEVALDAGTVSTASGLDSAFYCVSGIGGGASVIAFDSTDVSIEGASFTYVVTDTEGNILGLPPGDEVDFAPAGVGECWVWGLAFTGNVLVGIGDNAATDALTDQCWDLSDNFVRVFRDSVDGGMVTTTDGRDTVSVCLGASPVTFDFMNETAAGGNYSLVVTDANGVILGVPPANTVDFAEAGPGECWVWGLSFTGDLLAQVGDTAGNIAISSGCFDLSDNYVVVFRDSIELSAGTVSTEAGQDTVFYCISGIGSDESVIAFDSTDVSIEGASFTYVVTDTEGNILGLPPGDEVDFAPAGVGECWVWGLAFTGNVLVEVGDNATTDALTDQCWDLSDNFVVVIRDSVDGGMVLTTDGRDTVNVCLGASPQTLDFMVEGATGRNFTYVVTDNNGVILGVPPANTVDFADAGPGECWVWGLSYSGEITAQLGDTASAVSLSDGCYDLSDNFVVVFRDSVNLSGGMVMTESGADSAFYCVSGIGGGESVIAFDSTGVMAGGASFTYVVTDEAGNILGLPPGDEVDFGPAGPGVCLVWGLTFTGNVLAQIGDNAMEVALTDQCWDLSDNFVTVIRDSVNGGTITSRWGSDTTYVCLTDPTSTTVGFDSTGTSGMNFAYVVTDPDLVILGLSASDEIDFSGAGIGECWVWGLAYAGEVTAQLGDTASAVTLADGCYDLSDNFVVVFRDSAGDACIITDLEDDLVKGSISLVPVPATDQITLKYDHAEVRNPQATIQVFNLNGQQVFERKVSAFSGQNEYQIRIQDWPNGMYYLQMRHQEVIYRQRFVKN